MTALRGVLGGSGALLAAFGVFRLLTEIDAADLLALGTWLLAALLLHDGLLAPLTLAAGALLGRAVRPRARRYVAGALVAGVGVSAVTVPLVHRRGTQPPATALLQQDYAAHLGWLWIGIGATAGVLYLVRVVRDAASPGGSR